MTIYQIENVWNFDSFSDFRISKIWGIFWDCKIWEVFGIFQTEKFWNFQNWKINKFLEFLLGVQKSFEWLTNTTPPKNPQNLFVHLIIWKTKIWLWKSANFRIVCLFEDSLIFQNFQNWKINKFLEFFNLQNQNWALKIGKFCLFGNSLIFQTKLFRKVDHFPN